MSRSCTQFAGRLQRLDWAGLRTLKGGTSFIGLLTKVVVVQAMYETLCVTG